MSFETQLSNYMNGRISSGRLIGTIADRPAFFHYVQQKPQCHTDHRLRRLFQALIAQLPKPTLYDLGPDLLHQISKKFLSYSDFTSLTCASLGLNLLAPTLLQGDSVKIGQLLSDLLAKKNEVQLNKKLAKLHYLEGTHMPITITIRNSIWSKLPSYLSVIKSIFPKLHLDVDINEFAFNNFSFVYKNKVTTLVLTGLRSSNLFLQCIADCQTLQSLKIHNCPFFPTVFKHTFFAPTLIEIDLEKSAIDDEGLTRLLNHCPHLQKLNITGCSYLTIEHLVEAPFPDTLEELHGLSDFLKGHMPLTLSIIAKAAANPSIVTLYVIAWEAFNRYQEQKDLSSLQQAKSLYEEILRRSPRFNLAMSDYKQLPRS